MELAAVQVDTRAVLVRDENHLGQSVSIQVADRDTTTVVEIAVGEDVQFLGLGEPVFERHPRDRRRELREERVGGRRWRSLRELRPVTPAGTSARVNEGGQRERAPQEHEIR
jgi:hypothetical protein